MKPSELLTDESKWARGCYARDKQGESVPPESQESVCWCMIGVCLASGIWDSAIDRRLRGVIALEANRGLVPSLGEYPEVWDIHVASFNDAPETTFEQVKRVLVEAGL